MATSEETRRLLIDAAGPLFAAKGLEATTVRDITARAGVNVSAIHYHFRGMTGLYLEAVRQAATACMTRAVFPDWPPSTPPQLKLRDFIDTELRRLAVDCKPEWHPQLIMRELAQPTPACAEFAQNFVKPNLAVILGILREMLPDADARQLRLCAFSIVGQLLFYRFARPVIRELSGEKEFLALDVETLREHIYEFSVAAVRSLARAMKREAS